MKFCRVTHVRCGEPDGTTYCFIPDDWTEEQFWSAVYAARKKYEQATQEYMEELKAGDLQGLLYFYGGGGQPDYKRYPDKTVKEVQELFEKEKKEKLRRKAILDEARKPFGSFLRAEGVQVIGDTETEFDVELNWGHQHGVPLQYRSDNPYLLDKQGAATSPEEEG